MKRRVEGRIDEQKNASQYYAFADWSNASVELVKRNRFQRSELRRTSRLFSGDEVQKEVQKEARKEVQKDVKKII